MFLNFSSSWQLNTLLDSLWTCLIFLKEESGVVSRAGLEILEACNNVLCKIFFYLFRGLKYIFGGLCLCNFFPKILGTCCKCFIRHYLGPALVVSYDQWVSLYPSNNHHWKRKLRITRFLLVFAYLVLVIMHSFEKCVHMESL